jgi:spore maturation protein B
MTITAISEQIGNTLLLLFLVGIPLYGHIRKVCVYDVFVEGAKEGFPTFLRIMPVMLGMLVAIGMLHASGAFDLFTQALTPLLNTLGFPPEIAPIAIIRPFSSSAAMATVADIMHTQGGNSYLSHLATVVAGTTDTTFYILAMYFGAANIRKTRHAVPTSIIVDIVGILSAVWITHWFLK